MMIRISLIVGKETMVQEGRDGFLRHCWLFARQQRNKAPMKKSSYRQRCLRLKSGASGAKTTCDSEPMRGSD
jgi:hypothetical protein